MKILKKIDAFFEKIILKMSDRVLFVSILSSLFVPMTIGFIFMFKHIHFLGLAIAVSGYALSLYISLKDFKK